MLLPHLAHTTATHFPTDRSFLEFPIPSLLAYSNTITRGISGGSALQCKIVIRSVRRQFEARYLVYCISATPLCLELLYRHSRPQAAGTPVNRSALPKPLFLVSSCILLSLTMTSPSYNANRQGDKATSSRNTGHTGHGRGMHFDNHRLSPHSNAHTGSNPPGTSRHHRGDNRNSNYLDARGMSISVAGRSIITHNSDSPSIIVTGTVVDHRHGATHNTPPHHQEPPSYDAIFRSRTPCDDDKVTLDSYSATLDSNNSTASSQDGRGSRHQPYSPYRRVSFPSTSTATLSSRGSTFGDNIRTSSPNGRLSRTHVQSAYQRQPSHSTNTLTSCSTLSSDSDTIDSKSGRISSDDVVMQPLEEPEPQPAFISRYIVFLLDKQATIENLKNSGDDDLIPAVKNMSSNKKYVGYITEVSFVIFLIQASEIQ